MKITDRAAGPPPAAPLIELRGASVCLGGRLALQSVDLMLNRGDRLALVGANGSGKTTLLRLLHGLLPASAGSRQVAAGGPGPLIMAMLFQRPFLLNFSCWRNITLGLWLRGVPRAERQA
ncbi:ATP-binding cassette domain-containing protein, partial [Ideonella sp.]|uniref:ATP-binding cassette domain-containing protein n=1 Tax=Ideonella sp. TaxID=1929293 RepID=UPI003BB75AB3